ncbi:unnamed protein product [Lactuca saligna]|uniref:Uncharacterized protein n=1 Tax=Lactuca saligna TaxID=75948 RepID=A0AA35V4X2_LACSI|nr:unnamed protein product [Lactuca saligna]
MDGKWSEWWSSFHASSEDQYEVSCSYQEVGESSCVHRFLVLDALISPFCQTKILTDTLSDGSWLLRQLLLYSETELNTCHLQSLKLLEGLQSSLIISKIPSFSHTSHRSHNKVVTFKHSFQVPLEYLQDCKFLHIFVK